MIRAIKAAGVAGQTVYGFALRPKEIVVFTQPLQGECRESETDRYFREKGIG